MGSDINGGMNWSGWMSQWVSSLLSIDVRLLDEPIGESGGLDIAGSGESQGWDSQCLERTLSPIHESKSSMSQLIVSGKVIRDILLLPIVGDGGLVATREDDLGGIVMDNPLLSRSTI